MTIPNDEWHNFDVLAVPSHEIENSANEVGVLHNLILFDLMNETHEIGDFEHFYNVF